MEWNKTAIQYNQLIDLTPEDQMIVEGASGQPLAQLDVDDVNSFLNGLYLFHKEAEEKL
jgi:hypothetical protein